ncbi:hypothetical protein SteCoe_21829 [Stentor coeruleus]|uniref:Uncharacterized protein n=1 Tax=Stentor coeruleus TaxID=5963 RepID=A0A1R2BP89_9CILI|nr:hypothetical protein SteCoe_21829 [Stentor coeruleus]
MILLLIGSHFRKDLGESIKNILATPYFSIAIVVFALCLCLGFCIGRACSNSKRQKEQREKVVPLLTKNETFQYSAPLIPPKNYGYVDPNIFQFVPPTYFKEQNAGNHL